MKYETTIPIQFEKTLLTTRNFNDIVEAVDNATNAKDIISIRDTYGRDVLAYIWSEYLSDSLRDRINGFFEF